MKYPKVPFRHHFDEPAGSQQLGLNNRRKIADPCACQQRRREPVVLVDRQIGLNVIDSLSFPFAWMKFQVFSGRQNEKARSRWLTSSWGVFGGLFFCRYSGLATS